MSLQLKAGERLAARGTRDSCGGLCFGDNPDASVTEAEALLLYALVRAIKPDIVVEIGTNHGFSTLHLAQGLKDNAAGHLHTAEISPQRRQLAVGNIAEAGLSDFVSFYDRIPQTLSNIDLAFFDAVHNEQAVRDYLNQVPSAKLILVHDGRRLDHVARAIAGSQRTLIMLSTDSIDGMAMVA